MENLTGLNKDNNSFAPDLNLDATTGICELYGESYLEAPLPFYTKINNWLKEYIETVRGPITFNFKFLYFNTSSSRCILDILMLLKDYEESGGKVSVNWYYDPANKLAMMQEVEDFSADSDMQITMLPLT